MFRLTHIHRFRTVTALAALAFIFTYCSRSLIAVDNHVETSASISVATTDALANAPGLGDPGENKTCASCHSRIDPLGFALENFDSIGRWRESYDNHRKIDASGTLLRKYDFNGIVEFKSALIKEERRFAKAFTGHLLRFGLSRELHPGDSLAVDSIVNKTAPDNFKLKSIIREVILSKTFSGTQN